MKAWIAHHHPVLTISLSVASALCFGMWTAFLGARTGAWPLKPHDALAAAGFAVFAVQICIVGIPARIRAEELEEKFREAARIGHLRDALQLGAWAVSRLGGTKECRNAPVRGYLHMKEVCAPEAGIKVQDCLVPRAHSMNAAYDNRPIPLDGAAYGHWFLNVEAYRDGCIKAGNIDLETVPESVRNLTLYKAIKAQNPLGIIAIPLEGYDGVVTFDSPFGVGEMGWTGQNGTPAPAAESVMVLVRNIIGKVLTDAGKA